MSTAINKITGKVSPSQANIVSSTSLVGDATLLPEVVQSFPHLLIVRPLDLNAQLYYFSLDPAVFDELRRSTEFCWASQECLARRSAQQAVGMGEEKITLKGTIFPGFKGGIKHFDTLRSIGARLRSLTPGYNDVLGAWCLKSVEEQSVLLESGVLRRQAFILAMATIYRVSDGDLLYHAYGDLEGTVEEVLDANQGLADEP